VLSAALENPKSQIPNPKSQIWEAAFRTFSGSGVSARHHISLAHIDHLTRSDHSNEVGAAPPD